MRQGLSNESRASEAIRARKEELARALVEEEFARHPELEERYGGTAAEKSLQDAKYHLSYLAESLAHGNPGIFDDYVAWAKIVLVRRGVSSDDFAFHLEVTRAILEKRLPGAEAELAVAYLSRALERLPSLPVEPKSQLDEKAPLHGLARDYLAALLARDRRTAVRMISEAAEGGTNIQDLYLHVFQPVQREVGRLWQINELTVGQEHYCSAATQLAMSQLYPHLFRAREPGVSRGSVMVCCLSGELHELGARMLADFLELERFDAYYLGANTPVEDVAPALADSGAKVICLSVTMTYHLGEATAVIERVRNASELGDVKIVIGGHALNESEGLWKSLGADAYAADAPRAVAAIRKLIHV